LKSSQNRSESNSELGSINSRFVIGIGKAQSLDSNQLFDSVDIADIKMEDRNADGCLDIVIIAITGDEIVYRNDCSGNFTEMEPTPTPTL
jgi:hypothetical protein